MPKIVYSQDYIDVSDKIRSQRKRAGMTQEQLAEKANLDCKTVQRLESVQVKPTIDTFFQVARALGVTPNDLTPDSYISRGEHKSINDLRIRFSKLSESNQRVFIASASAMLDGFLSQQAFPPS